MVSSCIGANMSNAAPPLHGLALRNSGPAKADPFDLGSPYVVSVLVWPVSPGFWEPEFCGRPCAGLVCCFLNLNWWLCVTVSPAKRTSPKFMKMVCFLSYLLAMTDQVAWTRRQLQAKSYTSGAIKLQRC